MRSYSTLDVGVEDDVFRIAFDRPDQYNASNPTMHEELTDVFNDAYDSEARVVLLTGNGKAFSAGGDIDYMHERNENPDEYSWETTRREGEEIIESILNLEKPLVAKVNGDAIGLGATLALFCDIVVASEDARIGDPHVNVGLAAGDGGAIIWPLLTNVHTAKEFLMTGKLVTGGEAEELGLVNHAVSPDELHDVVDELITELATGPQLAIRYTKLAINNWLQNGVDEILRESLALEGITQRHPDHREAVRAFREDREPDLPSARTSDED